MGTYRFDIGPGRLSPTLAYNYNKTDVSKYDPNVISPARIIDIQHYAPNNRANLTLDYQLGPFQATLHENYYGTFRDENDYPGQLFSKTETTDLDLAYTVWRNVTVAIGGKNITNEYPDKIKNSSSNTVYSTTGGLIDGEVYPAHRRSVRLQRRILLRPLGGKVLDRPAGTPLASSRREGVSREHVVDGARHKFSR